MDYGDYVSKQYAEILRDCQWRTALDYAKARLVQEPGRKDKIMVVTRWKKHFEQDEHIDDDNQAGELETFGWKRSN